jgi:tRNA modification GTPase
MNFLYSDDTIIACSTNAQSNAAMAVIRISGFTSLIQFKDYFKKDLSGPIEPRKVYFTQLVLQGQVLDDICLTYFEGPRSYNGENILELSVHGNTLNIDRIINLFVTKATCRMSFPGEFTYRALKNKKISLSQVEGLDLFLNANSTYALSQGQSLLSGNLHEIYKELYHLFLVHKSSLELSIDFSDDIGEDAARIYFTTSFHAFKTKFDLLFKRVQPMEHNLLSPEIVLTGLPNAGKSSFFNFILSDDRAIISSHPGTTRDYLSESIVIEGVKYKLIDTAGIRNTVDTIEAEGIRRSREKLLHSFFSVLLINPFQSSDELSALLGHKFDLILFTHKDVPGFNDARQLQELRHPMIGPTGAVNLLSPGPGWEDEFKTSVNKKYLHTISSNPILLDRHKNVISDIYDQIKHYQQVVSNESDVAILSQELNTLGHCISELIGIISPDQVLNSIFSNFCIGK